MALYAFDGTWNEDENDSDDDTNVVKFRDIYNIRAPIEYRTGVGTRFGRLGQVLGGLFGVGGRSRIEEMYDAAKDNWANGDKIIDIVGFSRGAALAVHFANILSKHGLDLKDGNTVIPEIRFLGVWDIVGAFGFPLDFVINFQKINLGWTIDEIPANVKHCFHALSLNERRQTFDITRPKAESPDTEFVEMWFKGVHSDIGGGNDNEQRSNIALAWMLECGLACGLPLEKSEIERVKLNTDTLAPIKNNADLVRHDPRSFKPDDKLHPSAVPLKLKVGDKHVFPVYAENLYSWGGIELEDDGSYQFTVPDNQQWKDNDICCGPAGWTSEELPWYKEGIVKHFEKDRRVPEANWFELIGSLGDDDEYFRIGKGDEDHSPAYDAELYAFANDMKSKYGNNEGVLMVTVKRVG
jgi:hypothetical protein